MYARQNKIDYGSVKNVAGEFVTADDGSGIVHMAPAFGADDMEASRAYGLPVVNPIRPDGRFEDDVPLVGGRFFKDADQPLTLTVDGTSHSVSATLLTVGNGAYFGGDMKVCPTASLHDGLVDVTVIGPIGRIELLREHRAFGLYEGPEVPLIGPDLLVMTQPKAIVVATTDELTTSVGVLDEEHGVIEAGVRELGRDLATLHANASECADPNGYLDPHDRPRDYELLLSELTAGGYVGHDAALWVESMLCRFQPFVASPSSYRRFLHGDVTPGNVMVDGDRYGSLIDLVERERADCIVRGIRAVSDFEYEFQMALMNRELAGSIETVFMMPDAKYSYISSRLIKEVFSLGGRVHGLVPELVEQRLREKQAVRT